MAEFLPSQDISQLINPLFAPPAKLLHPMLTLGCSTSILGRY